MSFLMYSPFHCFVFFIIFLGAGLCEDRDLGEIILQSNIIVHKDGRVERFVNLGNVPPSLDSKTGVDSKDAVVSPETGLRVRLYLPKITNPPDQKLPLLVFFHGGGFFSGSIVTPHYHNFLNTLVSEANVVAVSVDYRLAPEHLCPTFYDDSWEAFKWVVSHCTKKGPELWLNDHVDFQRVFLAGDSAGANIAYNMAMRAGNEGLDVGVKLVGIILAHPYFWGTNLLPSEVANPPMKSFIDKTWKLVCPMSSGFDDPRLNPIVDPKMSSLGCTKVLVCVAQQDTLRDRGRLYYEMLGKSGWQGVVEIMEAEGEDHVFFILKPTSEKAVAFRKRVTSFINEAKLK